MTNTAQFFGSSNSHGEMLMANVRLERVTKRFPDATIAVAELSLEIDDQEFLVLVGPSGCGKSTTLRLIAGLETSTSGVVRIGERDVTHVAPKDRDIAMVFQSYALYPHLSVYKNLSFGLRLRWKRSFGGGVIGRGLRKIFQPQRAVESAQQHAEIDSKVRQAASRLGIEHLFDRKPHQLSGGERQRVALGRAIVRNPAAFLLDEPLSNLDAKLRQQLRVELKRIHRELKATMVYVTHDQVEAMTLGDRVAVMNEGVILQVGSPLEVYRQPANLFVASFIGSVPINLCRGTVRRLNDRIRFESEFQIEWRPGTPAFQQLKTLLSDDCPVREVVLGFRAEDVRVSDEEGWLVVEVTQIDRIGESTMVHSRICRSEVNGLRSDELTSGELNKCKSSDEMILARLDPDAALVTGDRVKLIMDQSRMLWFDPESGENLLKELK